MKNVRELRGKGPDVISVHIKPSGSAVAFQTDAVLPHVSGYALPVQPGQRT